MINAKNKRASAPVGYLSELGGIEAALVIYLHLCSFCKRHCRRPLMHHSVACRYLGSDEYCFANFIAAAATRAREDAMMIATLRARRKIAAFPTQTTMFH